MSDDQVALVEGVRHFCDGRLPPSELFAVIDRGGFDRALWQDMAELGVLSLRLDEQHGGVGLGWVEAVLVFEALGRSLAPGPLVWSHLAAPVIAGAATGELVVGGLRRDDPVPVLEHHTACDAVLVVDRDGVWQLDAGALDLREVSVPLDPLTPVARVGSPPRGGEQLGDAALSAQLRLGDALLRAALAVGIASAVVDRAVTYASERVQFGRPVGSFQALKHLMADMAVRAELARAAIYVAGVTLDDPAVGSAERAVLAAGLTAHAAACANARDNVQVHGGMGYTWEVDAHLFLKRAYALAAGSRAGDDAERLSRLAFSGPAPTVHGAPHAAASTHEDRW